MEEKEGIPPPQQRLIFGGTAAGWRSRGSRHARDGRAGPAAWLCAIHARPQGEGCLQPAAKPQRGMGDSGSSSAAPTLHPQASRWRTTRRRLSTTLRAGLSSTWCSRSVVASRDRGGSVDCLPYTLLSPRIMTMPGMAAVGHKGFYCLRLFLSVRIVRETEKPERRRKSESAGTGPARRGGALLVLLLVLSAATNTIIGSYSLAATY